ncbi:MAG: hypothetical protein J5922_02800 [Clostridia bacterium]|nr:hypothetical protein [Clostridia bacterium]
MEKWYRMTHNPVIPLGKDRTPITGSDEHLRLCYEAGAEGAVLLKNDGTLPLSKHTKVAIFGKGSVNYIKGGSAAVTC